jgi:hypothetical protein
LYVLVLQYYLGVAEERQRLGILQPDSQLAGASAGSLIVACLKSGLPLPTCPCPSKRHAFSLQTTAGACKASYLQLLQQQQP